MCVCKDFRYFFFYFFIELPVNDTFNGEVDNGKHKGNQKCCRDGIVESDSVSQTHDRPFFKEIMALLQRFFCFYNHDMPGSRTIYPTPRMV